MQAMEILKIDFFKCFSYILSFFYAFFNTEAHLDGDLIHSLKSKLFDVTLKRVSLSAWELFKSI